MVPTLAPLGHLQLMYFTLWGEVPWALTSTKILPTHTPHTPNNITVARLETFIVHSAHYIPSESNLSLTYTMHRAGVQYPYQHTMAVVFMLLCSLHCPLSVRCTTREEKNQHDINISCGKSITLQDYEGETSHFCRWREGKQTSTVPLDWQKLHPSLLLPEIPLVLYVVYASPNTNRNTNNYTKNSLSPSFNDSGWSLCLPSRRCLLRLVEEGLNVTPQCANTCLVYLFYFGLTTPSSSLPTSSGFYLGTLCTVLILTLPLHLAVTLLRRSKKIKSFAIGVLEKQTPKSFKPQKKMTIQFTSVLLGWLPLTNRKVALLNGRDFSLLCFPITRWWWQKIGRMVKQ